MLAGWCPPNGSEIRSHEVVPGWEQANDGHGTRRQETAEDRNRPIRSRTDEIQSDKLEHVSEVGESDFVRARARTAGLNGCPAMALVDLIFVVCPQLISSSAVLEWVWSDRRFNIFYTTDVSFKDRMFLVLVDALCACQFQQYTLTFFTVCEYGG